MKALFGKDAGRLAPKRTTKVCGPQHVDHNNMIPSKRRNSVRNLCITQSMSVLLPNKGKWSKFVCRAKKWHYRFRNRFTLKQLHIFQLSSLLQEWWCVCSSIWFSTWRPIRFAALRSALEESLMRPIVECGSKRFRKVPKLFWLDYWQYFSTI